MATDRNESDSAAYVDEGATFDDVLAARGDRELQPLYAFLDRNYSDGAFTLLDVGCGPANLTQKIAARYPDSRVIGLDLDASGAYTDTWDSVKATTPNIKNILRCDMLDADRIQAELKRQFGEDHVDLVFSHAALMYLHGKTLNRFLTQCASFAKWVVTRDTSLEWGATLIGDDDCAESLEILGRFHQDFLELLSRGGPAFCPPTQADVDNTGFDFDWYLDHEDYVSNGEGLANLATYMKSAKATVSLLGEEKGQDYVDKARQAFDYFGEHGTFHSHIWQVSILRNRRI